MCSELGNHFVRACKRTLAVGVLFWACVAQICVPASGAETATRSFDVIVYGGTSAGVAAAVQADRMGSTVAIVCPETHLGGLSAGGLGWTDTGNKAVIGGIAREFYHRVWQHYQRDEAWPWQDRADYGNRGQGTPAIDGDQRTMWIFEPHVAEGVFEALIAEHEIPVFADQWLDREGGVEKAAQRITAITTLDGNRYEAKAFIDATYEGDLLAAAGVSYTVGREGQDAYDERWAGVQTGVLHHRHHFGVLPPISPYRVAGDPQSGLLPLVSAEPPGEYGSADHRVQAYCFRMCLTNHPDNRVPFPKPDDYDPDRYALLQRILDAGWSEVFSKFDPIPNRKTDTNNHGPLSTDFIGGSYAYPEASYAERREIIDAHRRYQQGWLYYLANEPAVPESIREQMQQWGLAADEFVDNDHWPHQIYVREARRMVGHYVMTEHELLKKRPTPESVGMGSYTIDSHNVQRYVTPEGFVQNEGDIGVSTPGPYEIAFGALLPKKAECENLVVPVCVSSSHVAFGSIRMEPVFMILGQSAATAAVMATSEGIAVQDVPYAALRERLLADGQVLEYQAPADGVLRSELDGIVLDDRDATKEGHWETSRSVKPYLQFGYLHDGNTRDGKSSITFEGRIAEGGTYQLRVIYPPNANRASQVPVTVMIGEQHYHVTLDQRRGRVGDGLTMERIGSYEVPAGSVVRVRLSNQGVTGYVVADGVQWLREASGEVEAGEVEAGAGAPECGLPAEFDDGELADENDAAGDEHSDRQAAENAPLSFNRDIRPLLSDRCFACHGPDAGTREADLRLDVAEDAYTDRGGYAAVVPGNAEASEIFARITSDDPGMVMPPEDGGKPLTAEEVALVRRWLQEGAEYQEHWSFVPVVRPQVPDFEQASESVPADAKERAIDAFVNAGLAEAGLTANPPAEPRTLIRRLAFDLTGLPPRPEWVTRYQRDPSDATYRELVEEMLASPQYGERMAMYWLDLVRYADTLGYHGDQVRTVWPYRDWVIRAFNENMPFDQFTIEQLAGDLLPNATLSQKVASTYNRLNRASGEGGGQPKEYLAKYAADRVRTTGAVWLGTTFGCAECHDHKFDPYTAKNFYEFAAFFADIKEQGIVGGARHIAQLKVPSPEQSAQLAALEEERKRVVQQLEEATPSAMEAWAAWLEDLESQATLWTVRKPSNATSTGGANLQVDEEARVLAGGTNPDKDEYVLEWEPVSGPIGAIRVELLPHPSLPAKGPGRAGNGNLVLHALELSQGDRKAEWTMAVATHSQVNHDVQHLISRHANGWAILPRVGQPLTLVLATKEPLVVDPEGGPVRLRIRQNHGAGHNLGHFRVSVTAAGAAELPTGVMRPELVALAAKPADQRSAAETQQLRDAFQREYEVTKPLVAALEELERQRKAIDAQIPTTLGCEATEPRVMRLLPRGNWMDDSGPIVEPGVPEFLAGAMDMTWLAQDRRLNRLDLARWFVRPDHPLVARTMVNRWWMLMFGDGLASSEDDLGSQGAWPTHPELLDWLAAEYVESGWDTKHMLRLMVLSDAYRRSSKPSDVQRARDPYNRLLARQSRWRLEAEMVRDNALAVSGLLVSNVGGPSVKPYQPAGYWGQLNFPKRTYQHDNGEAQYRRGLYTHWQRTFLHPSLLAFDAPAREECTAQRSRSNTPLQSLVLLNDPTYVEAAKQLAVELLRATGEQTEVERLDWLYRRVLQRAPRDEEVEVLQSLLRTSREEFAADPERAAALLQVGQQPMPESFAAARVASWMAVTRALLNLHETITRY